MKHRILSAAIATALSLGASAAEAPKTAAKPKPAEKSAPAAEAAGDKKEAAKFVMKDPVAVVNGQEIKASEVENMAKKLLAQRGGSIEDVPEENRGEMYRNVLDGVILDKLVTVHASKVEISDEEVAKAFDDFKKQFNGDEKAMLEQFKEAGQDTASVRAELKRFMQQNRWIEEQIKGKISVTDAEAEEIYKSNPGEFKKPEQVRASHILVKVEKDAKDDAVKAKKAEADKILARVKKGEDFNKLASEVSEDPSAKQNGGDLDFFEREQMVPEFSTAAFGMKKDEISKEPVRSDFGFHIIKVTDRKEAGVITLEEAKPKLTAYLQNQKRQDEIGKILRGLREGAKITINLPSAE